MCGIVIHDDAEASLAACCDSFCAAAAAAFVVPCSSTKTSSGIGFRIAVHVAMPEFLMPRRCAVCFVPEMFFQDQPQKMHGDEGTPSTRTRSKYLLAGQASLGIETSGA